MADRSIVSALVHPAGLSPAWAHSAFGYPRAEREPSASRPKRCPRRYRRTRCRWRWGTVPSRARRCRAAAVFAERGYTDTTLAELIARSGLTKGAFYFHFASKEQLALAVLEEKQRQWLEFVRQRALDKPRAIDQLRALGPRPHQAAPPGSGRLQRAAPVSRPRPQTRTRRHHQGPDARMDRPRRWHHQPSPGRR